MNGRRRILTPSVAQHRRPCRKWKRSRPDIIHFRTIHHFTNQLASITVNWTAIYVHIRTQTGLHLCHNTIVASRLNSERPDVSSSQKCEARDVVVLSRCDRSQGTLRSYGRPVLPDSGQIGTLTPTVFLSPVPRMSQHLRVHAKWKTRHRIRIVGDWVPTYLLWSFRLSAGSDEYHDSQNKRCRCISHDWLLCAKGHGNNNCLLRVSICFVIS